MTNHIAESVFSHLDKNVSFVRDNTILLCRGGSWSYGTNTPDSDEDFKGVCAGEKRHYLGSAVFEQAELKKPDAVLFEITKFVRLAEAANPNVIEALFVDPSDQIIVSPIGEQLLEHRDKFLSKRVKHTFMGYAVAQLKRIKTHRRWLMNPVKEPPTRKSLGLPEQTLIPQDQMMAATAEIQKRLDNYQFDFLEGVPEATKISIRGVMAEMLAELKITTEDQWMSAARQVGMSDNFIAVIQKEREYTNKKREFEQYQEWKKNRNVKRAADEAKYGYDPKHAMHLVRLARCARELLETGKLIVKRPDAEELLAIRRGAWAYDDLVEYAEKQDAELQLIYETSTALPKTPDFEFLENLCISLVEQSLSGA